MGEITKLIKEKQPVQLVDPVDLDVETPIKEREENDVTVLANLGRQRNMGQTENVEQSD